MTSLSFEKVWFVLSVALLSFGYGFASHAWGWFPRSYVQQAWVQLQALTERQDEDRPFLAPQVYERNGARTVRPQRMQPGMTLITSAWKASGEGWNTKLKLIDESGSVLHEWAVDRTALFQSGGIRRRNPKKTDIHGSYLLPGGDVLVNVEYVGLARLDACGAVQWTLQEGNHHSIARAQDGSFWVPGVRDEPRTSSAHFPEGYPGLEKPVWPGRVLRVSGEGKILSAFNVLDVIYQNDLERYIPKVLAGHRPDQKGPIADLVHVNDVEPLPPAIADEYPDFDAGDLLISVRNLQLVFVMDPDTKEVKWYESDRFIYQHDPDFLGDGWIGVFDNNSDFTDRGTMLGGSRIIAFQPHTGASKLLFPTPHSDPFYTAVQGKWQLLENGNLLLTETVPGRVVEVTPKGRTVWEWIHKAHESTVPYLTKGARHNLTRAEIASWPCSSIDSADAAAPQS